MNNERIKEILLDISPCEIDFTVSDTLVEDGVLDSLTITEIIGALSLEFEIQIPYEEIKEENFNSVSAMAGLVSRMQK